MIASHYQQAKRLIDDHTFFTALIESNKDKMKMLYQDHPDDKYIREMCFINDKIVFLTNELIKTEHEMITLAIRWNVPYTSLLMNGHAAEFYKYLLEKGDKIDHGEVVRISKKYYI